MIGTTLYGANTVHHEAMPYIAGSYDNVHAAQDMLFRVKFPQAKQPRFPCKGAMVTPPLQDR